MGIIHAVICAAIATIWLWLVVSLSSFWLLVFSALTLGFLIFFILFDAERLWRRIGTTLIAAALLPSGLRLSGSVSSPLGAVALAGSLEKLGIPEWLPLVAGCLFLVLDGIWIRSLGLWGSSASATPAHQRLDYRSEGQSSYVTIGRLYLQSATEQDFTFYGAVTKDFFWMRLLRSASVAQHGFQVLDPTGAWIEPSRNDPMKLARRKKVECSIRLDVDEGRVLKFLRWVGGRLGFGREVTIPVTVECVGNDVNITVSAVQGRSLQ